MGYLNEHITPTGYRLGGTPTNENPFWGDGGGNTKNITATASVDNTTGTPAVEVTKTETTEAVNFDFAFSHLKGEPGEKGDDGATPEVSATATITDTGSVPSVTVTTTGTTEAPVLNFTFDHIGGGGGGEDTAGWKRVGSGQVEIGDVINEALVTYFDSIRGTEGFSDYFNSWTGSVELNVKGLFLGELIFDGSTYNTNNVAVESAPMYNINGEYTSNPVGLGNALEDGSFGTVHIDSVGPTVVNGYVKATKSTSGDTGYIDISLDIDMEQTSLKLRLSNTEFICTSGQNSFGFIGNGPMMGENPGYLFIDDKGRSFSTPLINAAGGNTPSGSDVFRIFLGYMYNAGGTIFMVQNVDGIFDSLNDGSMVGVPYYQIVSAT